MALPLRLFYPCKLQARAAGLFQYQLVARNSELINCRCELRFNFDSVLVTEFVSAHHVANEDGAVWFEFPHRCIGTSRHPPFADDAGISAATCDAQQGC